MMIVANDVQYFFSGMPGELPVRTADPDSLPKHPFGSACAAGYKISRERAGAPRNSIVISA
jgi:hypothetical protein